MHEAEKGAVHPESDSSVFSRRDGTITDGRAEGDKARLVSTITKKLQKGKNLEEIADAVEESVDTVKQLIQEIVVKA